MMADPDRPDRPTQLFRLRENFFNMRTYEMGAGQGVEQLLAGMLGQQVLSIFASLIKSEDINTWQVGFNSIPVRVLKGRSVLKTFSSRELLPGSDYGPVCDRGRDQLPVCGVRGGHGDGGGGGEGLGGRPGGSQYTAGQRPW